MKKTDSSRHTIPDPKMVEYLEEFGKQLAEYLEPKPGLILTPPPAEDRCECCGRHASELKALGKGDNAFYLTYARADLFRNFRPNGPCDEISILAMDEAQKPYRPGSRPNWEVWMMNWLVNRYDKEEGVRVFITAVSLNTARPSRECRDCIVLNTAEYFEKLRMTYNCKRAQEPAMPTNKS